MNVLGVWPKSPSIFRVGVALLYYSYCLGLIYLSFFLALGNFRKVLRTISEIITFTQVYYRLLTLRRHMRDFGDMLDTMVTELDPKMYKNSAEKNKVLMYHRVGRRSCKLLVVCLGMTVFMYFLKPLIGQFGSCMYTCFGNYRLQ